MFAPVVTRFVTYGVAVPPFAARLHGSRAHRADVVEWIELAQDEPWVIEQYEPKATPGAPKLPLGIFRPVAPAKAAVVR